jgi:hypothetical protein
MGTPLTYRRRLREVALEQRGYITTRDAERLGIPRVELRKLAKRGGLTNVAYGVYRFDDIPRGDDDQYMEAVLSVGPDAYLVGESVLALHRLAFVEPRKVRVASPNQVRRRRLPAFIEVVKRTRQVRLDPRSPVPAQPLAEALLESRKTVMGERLIQATREARSRGLLTGSDENDVLRTLEGHA